MKISPSKRVSYWSFGFLPFGGKGDIVNRFRGYPNLVKRVQIPSILKVLALRDTDVCLDMGCGSGYITIELAKIARKAIGVDINPSIAKIKVPNFLNDKLQFIVQDARSIPLPDNSVDVVLCSEVLMMIPDPKEFLNELRRVIRPQGRLISVSGLGHPAIREGYNKRGWIYYLARMILKQKMPATYEDYLAALQKHFETAVKLEDINTSHWPKVLENNGFTVVSIEYSPSKLAGEFCSWLQFYQFNLTDKGVTKFTFLRFLIATCLNFLGREAYKGGQIVSAVFSDN